jgi:hypothetical protein
MKKLYILLFSFLISGLSFGQDPVINEVDADNPGTDAAEFIEILHTPSTSLSGYVVVLFNGSSDTSYAAYDLDGKSTDADGFFILANTALASGSDIVINDNSVQNGADAIAIYQADDTDFPNGTAVTNVNLVDALVYDTADTDDAGLLAGLGEVTQYDEAENGAKDTESVQRKNDGTYETKAPTFRQDNNAAVCELSLTGNSAVCEVFTAGADTYTARVFFSGGGTTTYNVMADSGIVDGDDPTSVASGIIKVTGVSEGTDVIITVDDGGGGLCNLQSTVTSPTCNASALSLPIYEDFNYTPSTNLVDSPNWTNISSSSDEVLVESGNLSYSGLPASTGNLVSFDGVGSDPAIMFTPIVSGSIYASFIFKVTDQTAMTDLTDGGYIACLGNFDSRIWVRPNPDADPGTTFDIGYGSLSSNPPVTPGTYNVGDEIFVVMSYDTSTGDASVWINPNSGDFGGSAPATSLTENDAFTPFFIGQFFLRQDSTGETPFVQFDELRIGTSWAYVTTGVLSTDDFTSNNLSIYPNPTSLGHVNIKSRSGSNMNVSVFDLLGKQVLKETVNNERLNVSSLNAGVYIMKVSQDDATTTKKLVIK